MLYELLQGETVRGILPAHKRLAAIRRAHDLAVADGQSVAVIALNLTTCRCRVLCTFTPAGCFGSLNPSDS